MQKKNKYNIGKDAFSNFIQSIVEPIIILNTEGLILECNDGFANFVGMQKKELSGKRFFNFSFLDPQTKIFLKEKLKKRIKGEPVDNYRIPIQSTEGKKYVEPKRNIIRYNEELADLVIFHDTTQIIQDQQKLESELHNEKTDLKKAKERVKSLAKFPSENPYPIMRIAKDNRILYLNESGRNLFKNLRDSAEVLKELRKKSSEAVASGLTKNAVAKVNQRSLVFTIIPISGTEYVNVYGFDITVLKKTEKKLREALEKQRVISSITADFLFSCTRSNRTTEFVVDWMSGANEKIFGYTLSEIKEKGCWKFTVHPQDQLSFEKNITDLKVGQASECELRVTRKDGATRWIKVSARVSKDSKKPKLERLFGAMQDITEQKKSELEIKKSEEKYRTIFSNAGVGMFRSRLDGSEILDCNEKFLKIFGRTREEMVGKPSVMQWADPIERKAMVRLLLSKGQVDDFECKMRNKQGEIRNCLASLILYRDQNVLEGSITDITERKIKDKELLLEKNKIEAVTQSIGAGVLTISKDYKVQWANKFMKERRGPIEGKHCYSTLNDLDHECPGCGAKKIFENDAYIHAHEYSINDINGNPIWIEVIATPIKDATGQVISAVEVAIDITEKKNLQNELGKYSHSLEKLVVERTEQLKETQDKLVKSERLAAIGELAAMVGHDLRNPLSGIKNAAYFLEKKGCLISEAQATQMFNAINRCIEHSNKIINDLLDYSRDIHLAIEKNSLKKLLDDSLEMINKPENVLFENKAASSLMLKVDGEKVCRVFTNLLKNAIDAMPNGGKITIESAKEDNSIIISVSDTGIGISDEVLPKIFTPLVTTKAQGMGFGLAICKRIVEAHGGTLTVKTAKGSGSTFTVKLPVEAKTQNTREKSWICLPETSSLTAMKARAP